MFLRVLFVCLSVLCVTNAQLIIPPRPLGYVYNNGSSDAPIHMDVHMGPLCPDSAGALPVIQQVADYYKSSTVRLTLHMFPLPYHRQSYFTAIGAQVMRKLYSTEKAYCYFNEIYTKGLEQLSNDKTKTMTAIDVNNVLASHAEACGAEKAAFYTMLQDEELENKVRTAWKYTCTRGISGTPTFLLNDVTVAADPSWTLKEWREVIDPLLQEAIKEQTCPIGTKKCEYLPGKTECCTHGENCIPNVGCRCFGENCLSDQTCPSDTKKCEYLPGKVECCTKGENCIPDVGCRCFKEGDCKSKENVKEFIQHRPLV